MTEEALKTHTFHAFRIFNEYRTKLIAGRFTKNLVWAIPSVIHNDTQSAYDKLIAFLETNIFGDGTSIISIINTGEYTVEAEDPSVGRAKFRTLLYEVKYFGAFSPKIFGDFSVVRWMRPEHLFVQHQLNRPTAAAKILMENEDA